MRKKNEVTDIRVNVKRPDRRSIYINGEFAFSLSEGVFYERNIHIGDLLADEEVEDLIESERHHKIEEAAFLLLSYRQRSVKEIRDRLIQKGFDGKMVDSVIEKLEKKGYLDDREFAAMFAREKTRQKFLGPLALRYELRRTGVDSRIVDEVIERTYEQNPPEVLIQALLRKKKIGTKRLVTAKEKQRLVEMLKRKGFTWGQMEPVVSKLKLDHSEGSSGRE